MDDEFYGVRKKLPPFDPVVMATRIWGNWGQSFGGTRNIDRLVLQYMIYEKNRKSDSHLHKPDVSTATDCCWLDAYCA